MSDDKRAYKSWFHSTHPLYKDRELAVWLAACDWKDQTISSLKEELDTKIESIVSAECQVTELELKNRTLNKRIYQLENLVTSLTSQTKFVKFSEENIALKQALLNCRMERDDPDTVMMLVNKVLKTYPLTLEELDKR